MIHIADKYKCCGCGACIQACPKQCISFHTDEEGFAYPVVVADKCIDCGLCEKVCPCLHQTESNNPVHVYAAKNPDEAVRMQSSSGGIFSLLAVQTIHEGGVVFGARFNDQWEVIHDYSTIIEGLAAFRGSKYVQSRIGNTYKEAQQFLKEGRKVLYSGTPCQIAGLNLFLRKEYDNLLSVECVCHGVPSPVLWQQYLKEKVKVAYESGSRVVGINFRDKRNGWSQYGLSIKVDGHGKRKDLFIAKRDNLFMSAFLHNYSIRPSCYNCPAKSGKSGSDLTLGDFWGVKIKRPDCYDRIGVTVALPRTDKGSHALETLEALQKSVDYADAIYENACIEHSAIEPKDRNLFWISFKQGGWLKVTRMLNRLEPSKGRMMLHHIKHFLNEKPGK